MIRKLRKMMKMSKGYRHRLSFWLTCWMPVSRYTFLKQQAALIEIFKGFHESDLQHSQVERAIIDEIKKFADVVLNRQVKDKDKQNNDEMFG